MDTDALRGFHFRFGEPNEVDAVERLIGEWLAPLGVNVLVLECNDNVEFASHPELGPGGLTASDARRLSAACRSAGIRLIPLMQCFGHQGWGGHRNKLLRAYPEFDETPWARVEAVYPEFVCPSWCPSHPAVNRIAFDLIDELIESFGVDAFHVGLDEVWYIADDACPRCAGKDRADLFAQVVNDLHGHVVGACGVEMLMWSDRILDADALGYGEWEADRFGTHRAIDRIPTDIVQCDWHYDPLDAYPSVGVLLDRGFTVWPSSWKDPAAAVALLDDALAARADRPDAAARMPGMLVTGWDVTARGLEQVFRGETPDDPGRDEGKNVETLRAVLARLDDAAVGGSDR